MDAQCSGLVFDRIPGDRQQIGARGTAFGEGAVKGSTSRGGNVAVPEGGLLQLIYTAPDGRAEVLAESTENLCDFDPTSEDAFCLTVRGRDRQLIEVIDVPHGLTRIPEEETPARAC
ncbi:hypothetical protein GobsT_71640 [Gemmata obscuriglobus]|uniref:Uncharacterized protein n=1 Tax=Gemmata obscuriglobus TaxID=114 RepID=A0A2Z3HJV3_9BACT|nr:hypothetical protein C1280_35250 [Gemmata obscuriglobus]QEG32311.1 hypothetical protein GobsT_71640 [Gemmata obscuriglobus]VTS11667.1 unnamed protein product [Gemmata obscuriglobus UQM 2246]